MHIHTYIDTYIYIHTPTHVHTYQHSIEGLWSIVLGIVLDLRYSKRNVKPFCR